LLLSALRISPCSRYSFSSIAPSGAEGVEGADGAFSCCSQPSESFLALATRFPLDFLTALDPQTLSLLLPKLPPQASAIRRRVSRHRVSRHIREPPLIATTAAMRHRTRSHHYKPPLSQCAIAQAAFTCCCCHKPALDHAISRCREPQPQAAASSPSRKPPLPQTAILKP